MTAAESKNYIIGDLVVCNPDHPKIKADRRDEGWSSQYHKFLKGSKGIILDNNASGLGGGYKVEVDGDYFYIEDSSQMNSWTPETVAGVEYTGGSSNYYKVFVKNPTTLEQAYEAECNDIIEALQMTFAEGNAFKAIWRKAKARQGVQKKGYDNGLYDSEKVVFFGERMVVEAKEKSHETD